LKSNKKQYRKVALADLALRVKSSPSENAFSTEAGAAFWGHCRGICQTFNFQLLPQASFSFPLFVSV